jgi:hypothetical protein
VRRGTDPADGTDNINLPRFDLEPAPVTDLSLLPAGVDWVVAPTVVLYYSHNGGWFIGQRYGHRLRRPNPRVLDDLRHQDRRRRLVR